jgi:hypothetical protein
MKPKNFELDQADYKSMRRTVQLFFDTWVLSGDVQGCTADMKSAIVYDKNLLLRLLEEEDVEEERLFAD